MLALHAAASLPSLTSAKADHPLVATPAELAGLAQGLLPTCHRGAPPPPPGRRRSTWRAAAAAALHANRGAWLVVAGGAAPAAVQEAVHRINAALGNAGQTVIHTPPSRPRPGASRTWSRR